jgi:hypothetical protein
MGTNFRIWEGNAGQSAGFSAYLVRLLSQIHELDSRYNVYNNNEPIWIDWVYWPLPNGENYHEGNKMSEVNSWDYWFENPIDTNRALNSLKTEPNTWISASGQYHGYPPNQEFLWDKKDLVSQMGNYVNKYFKPRKDILDSLNTDILKYKTLAAHCRRSDLDWAHPNLRLGFTEEDYFNSVMKVFKHGNFEKIYLATEETAIYNYFMERVPELILCQHECYRVPQTESPVYNIKLDNVRPLHRYNTAKEVLIDILNMSNCHSMICFISGVSNMTTYFNNLKYEKIYYHHNVKNDIL